MKTCLTIPHNFPSNKFIFQGFYTVHKKTKNKDQITDSKYFFSVLIPHTITHKITHWQVSWNESPYISTEQPEFIALKGTHSWTLRDSEERPEHD